jgi:hypothetical protein
MWQLGIAPYRARIDVQRYFNQSDAPKLSSGFLKGTQDEQPSIADALFIGRHLGAPAQWGSDAALGCHAFAIEQLNRSLDR